MTVWGPAAELDLGYQPQLGEYEVLAPHGTTGFLTTSVSSSVRSEVATLTLNPVPT